MRPRERYEIIDRDAVVRDTSPINLVDSPPQGGELMDSNGARSRLETHRRRLPAQLARCALVVVQGSFVAAMIDVGAVSAQSEATNMCIGDADGDRVVTVAELVSAVNNHLYGCIAPTPPVGPVELTVLEAIASELVPNPGMFGCSAFASPTSTTRFTMTCEFAVGFATVTIDRFADESAASLGFDDQHEDQPIELFQGYDSFVREGPSLIPSEPSRTLVLRAGRWLLRSSQVPAVEGLTLYRDIAHRVLAMGAEADIF